MRARVWRRAKGERRALVRSLVARTSSVRLPANAGGRRVGVQELPQAGAVPARWWVRARALTTLVSPGVTGSEPADGISDPVAREAMRTYRVPALPAGAIAYAVSRPEGVEVNELVVRPRVLS